MTTTAPQPIAAISPQKVALLNLNMFMQLEGKYRKDLAEHMNKMPQSVSRMLVNNNYKWSFDDMCEAARFVGVSLDTLTDPTLTPQRALSIISERNNDEGGLQVAVDHGYRRQRSSGEYTLAA